MSKNAVSTPKIILEWKKPLGIKNDYIWYLCNWKIKPYAYRWRIDFFWFSIRLHKWQCSDDTRAYHSHPVNAIVFIIKGQYDEYRLETSLYNNPAPTSWVRWKVCRHAPCFYILKRGTKHYIKLKSTTAWSLLFTWGKPMKWGFWDRVTLKWNTRDKYFIENGQHICEE